VPTIADDVPPRNVPSTPEEVHSRVLGLLPTLRKHALSTEKMRRMHPDNLESLTSAGVFRLTVPSDVGGYEADDYIGTEVLAEISRSCPSTGWICTMILSFNCIPAMLGDDAAQDIYQTPDLRITGTITPTGKARPVNGGFQVSGHWAWNSGGVHSNWIATTCVAPTTGGPAPIIALIPASLVEHHDTWFSAGMSGTATNAMSVDDVFVPASRTLPMRELRDGTFPPRRYSANPYFNRPWVMWASVMRAACLLGIARGAMQVFMERLPKRGPITYMPWATAAEAPLLHHQLAKAQFDLEIAEMYMERLRLMMQKVWARDATVFERVQVRASLGQVATYARSCVNILYDASGASQALLNADIQRYFRDVNVVHQHAAIQPNSSNELYGRLLAGLQPDTDLY
jgi:3-hydroxy-9,10-secoandrosta-1,3,5(10)-triene-9,17-dione monooxygenase